MPPAASPPRRTRTVPPALLLAAAFLAAGCAEAPPAAPLQSGSPQAAATDALEDGTPARLATYAVGPLVEEERWFNGSFQLHEHCFPVGCLPAELGAAPPPFRTHDLSELVPVGLPVWLTAEVRADLQQGDLDVWFQMPWQEMWTGRWDTPRGGYSKMSILTVRSGDGPLRVVVAYDEAEPRPQVDYTLSVRVSADPDRLAEAVPVALQLPAGGARLAFELASPGEDAAVLLWDPEDRFLRREPFDGTRLELKLAEDAPAGEYVLLLTDGAGSAKLLVTTPQPEAHLRPLAADIVVGMRDFPAAPESRWTYHADRLPLQTGIEIVGPTVSGGFAATVRSPRGPLLEDAVPGGPWVGPFMRFGGGMWTRIGDADLAAGDYEATVRFDTAAGPDPIHTMDYLVYYAR